MLRHLCVPVVLFALVTSAHAQDSESSAVEDPTDLSRYEFLGDDLRAMSLEGLAQIEAEAREAVDSGDCESAIDLLVQWADAANVTANIVRQGLEPFYSARGDDQTRIINRAQDSARGQQLSTGEDRFNDLIKSRNEAWVLEAKCLLDTGEREQAVVRLYRALDYISGTEQAELWDEARTLLWNEIGFQP